MVRFGRCLHKRSKFKTTLLVLRRLKWQTLSRALLFYKDIALYVASLLMWLQMDHIAQLSLLCMSEG